jgi:trehalose synthase
VARLQEVRLAARSIDRFLPLLGPEVMREAAQTADTARQQLAGRILWHVNSTARGGGVAEMLHSLIAYGRGAGVNVRWVVIEGSPEFFRLTKRLHHALHGSAGDGSPLGAEQRALYERITLANARELETLVRPRDVVVLHDPQTAGLASHLARVGARVIWRCHIGADQSNEQTTLGWDFLEPYLRNVSVCVFSRQAYIPDWCDPQRAVVIQPSLDAFSPKNQELDQPTIRAILVHTGLIEGPPGEGNPTFRRADGAPGRVDRQADVIRLGRAPTWETPLVVQVSRWDPLKDHLGVMQAFADLVDGSAPTGAALMLVGPNVTAVADDPEGADTLDQVIAAWRQLAHADRRWVQIACLPMADAEENAAIVNALQRHATIVVQKSLREGFGLTVTEAMWKGRPIVASAVGGIQDQIEDGVQGLLVQDPTDLAAFGAAVRRLLEDPALAARLGEQAHQRVLDQFLGLRLLTDYQRLVERVDQPSGRPPPEARC